MQIAKTNLQQHFFTKIYNNIAFNKVVMAAFKKFANASELPTQGKANVRITEISCFFYPTLQSI